MNPAGGADGFGAGFRPRVVYHTESDPAEDALCDPAAEEDLPAPFPGGAARTDRPGAGRSGSAGPKAAAAEAPTDDAAAATKVDRLRAAVHALGGRVGYGARGAPAADRVSTGFAALDAALGGGFVRGALNEIYSAAPGDGAAEALLPALVRGAPAADAAGRARVCCWIHPARTPYPPALAQAGADLSRWLVVRPADDDDHLWALDLALRSRACALAVAPVGELSDHLLRRLQIAAEESGALGLLWRPAALAPRASPAAVRIAVESAPSPRPGRRRLVLRPLKARGVPFPEPVFAEWSRDPLDEPQVSGVLERAVVARDGAPGARRVGGGRA